MRISDWSSDVCSSDLRRQSRPRQGRRRRDRAVARLSQHAPQARRRRGGEQRRGAFRAARRHPDDQRRLAAAPLTPTAAIRSEEHTSELQSLMRISYAVFCLKKKTQQNNQEQLKYKIQTKRTIIN